MEEKRMYSPENAEASLHAENVREIDQTDESMEKEKEKKKRPSARSRRSLRRVLSAIVSLSTIFSPYAGAESSGKSEAPSVERASADTDADAAAPEHAGEAPPVAWDNRTYDRQEFNDILLEGFRESLGSLADRCDDAEQCFYYYGDQMGTDTRPIEALTGKSARELSFTARILRSGFARRQGMRMPGSYTGVVEAGRDLLPPAPREETRSLYRLLYEYHKTRIADCYADFRVPERSEEDVRGIEALVSNVVETSTLLAAFELQARYGLSHYGSRFREWFFQGFGGGLPSADAKWSQLFRSHEQALGALYAYASDRPLADEDSNVMPALRAFAMARAAQEYHGDRADLFLGAAEQSRTRLFSGDEADDWSALADKERERVRALESAAADMKKREVTLAAAAAE